MPGGVSHSTTTSAASLGLGGGSSHGLLGSHALLGGVSHAMPLASSAGPGYPFSSSSSAQPHPPHPPPPPPAPSSHLQAPPPPPPQLLDPSSCLPKIKLLDIFPEDGPPTLVYSRAVEELSTCLARHGAAIMELGGEDAALVRCALESATLYFRTRAQSHPWSSGGWSKHSGYVSSPSRDMYYFRAGRGEEVDLPPPCMSDVFRCLGKASRVALGAISRYLRLRSDAFYSLLDDCPLPDDSASSSVLVATRFHETGPNTKAMNGPVGALQEYEKGMLTLIAADSPGLQVCDANGQWYLADMGLRPGDLLVLTGRSLQHVTSGVCHAYAYRIDPYAASGPTSNGRTSLTFRLMPRSNETLDGSMMAGVGYSVSDRYGPVGVSKFLESLHVTDAMAGNRVESPLLQETNRGHSKSEPSLRSLLSDPLTGAILEDAYTSLGCGHSFGGGTFKKVMETQRCSTCGASVNLDRIIPNLALRAAAAAFKQEEMRRQQHHNSSRKRRKDPGEPGEKLKKLKELPGSPPSYDGSHHIKGVQYPFNVNEKVVIKGNKRTPEKFVGREAVVTSKCLNGWYLLRTLDNGESVRLQYRSLKASSSNGVNEQPTQAQSVGEMTS